MGTIYQFICHQLLGVTLEYRSAFIFSAICMLIWVVVYMIMGCRIIDRMYERDNMTLFVVLVAYTILAASLITGTDYIGSAETVMLIVTILDVYVITNGGNIVLMIIFPLIGMVAGSHYLFAFMGCIIVLLIARYILTHNNKYKVTAIINLISAVGFYIYYIIRGGITDNQFVHNLAKLLDDDGQVKRGLYDYYVNGISSVWSGFPETYVSVLRIFVTLILLIPIIHFMIICAGKLIKRAKSDNTTLPAKLYRGWFIGGISIVPLFVLGNNYGTWFFAIASYFLLTTLGFIMMGDRNIIDVLTDTFKNIRSNYKWLILLLIYLILFTPIDSVRVCTFVDNFVSW